MPRRPRDKLEGIPGSDAGLFSSGLSALTGSGSAGFQAGSVFESCLEVSETGGSSSIFSFLGMTCFQSSTQGLGISYPSCFQTLRENLACCKYVWGRVEGCDMIPRIMLLCGATGVAVYLPFALLGSRSLPKRSNEEKKMITTHFWFAITELEVGRDHLFLY